jgi:hypothetical protein
MRLPVHQVRKGQLRPAELCIQPQAEVMQRYLRGQARLQPAESMGPFPSEAEGMHELFLHRFHALAHSGQPASEPFGPRRLAIALGRADDLGTIGLPPSLRLGSPLEALVDDIWPAGRGAHTRQARGAIAAEGKERLRQGVSLRARRPKPEAGDHPEGVDRQEQLEALIPAPPVAPAHIGQAQQPARAAALGIPCGDTGALQRFIRTLLGCSQLHKMQQTRHQRLILLAHVAVALLPCGPRGKGGAQMPLGIAIKPACTAKAWPLLRAACGPGCVSRGKKLLQKSSTIT